jgi:hypothetical protein
VDTFKTDLESSLINIQYGGFMTSIRTVMVMINCYLDEEDIIGKGQFGTAFLAESQGKKIVVKAMPFRVNIEHKVNEVKKKIYR